MEKQHSKNFIASFCSELGMIAGTGIPVSDGLMMLIEDETDDSIKSVLEQLYKITASGDSLSFAMKKNGGFPDYTVNMVKIGEKTGRLDTVLLSLSDYYNRQLELSYNLRKAVTMPLLLITVLLAVIIVIITQVLPVFNEVFEQIGIDMSGAGGALLTVGTFINDFCVPIIAVLAILIGAIVILSGIKKTRDFFTEKFLRIAQGKRVNVKIASARFASGMAMTMASGLDLDDSLEMVKNITDNPILRDKIERCQLSIRNGKSFNAAVTQAGIFTPVYCRMLTVAYKTGDTDATMKKIAEQTENEAEEQISESISRIEPTLVIIMSVIVGIILLSVMLPLMSVMSAIG